MPPTSLIFLVGGQLASFAGLGGLGFRTPFRISSLPRGVGMRPGIYTIIEDVIAVDTGTGRPYREALEARYQASPLFRQMLHQLNLFWVQPWKIVKRRLSSVADIHRLYPLWPWRLQ